MVLPWLTTNWCWVTRAFFTSVLSVILRCRTLSRFTHFLTHRTCSALLVYDTPSLNKLLLIISSKDFLTHSLVLISFFRPFSRPLRIFLRNTGNALRNTAIGTIKTYSCEQKVSAGCASHSCLGSINMGVLFTLILFYKNKLRERVLRIYIYLNSVTTALLLLVVDTLTNHISPFY